MEMKWELWRNCLSGKDENSIWHTTVQMTWDTAMFRFLWESWNISKQKNPNQPKINHYIYEFILRGYFTTMSAAIRRLIDDYDLRGVKGVFSLTAILKDIGKNREYLTRKKYFQLRNLPYDTEVVEKSEQEWLLSHRMWVEEDLPIPVEIDSMPSKNGHSYFDRLSNKTIMNRSPDDIIDERVIDVLKAKLSTCNDVKVYVKKFIAHAATPDSREKINIEQYGISLKNIWNAQKLLFEVTQLLAEALFGEHYLPLMPLSPVAFEFWDVPLLESEDLPKLIEVYNKFKSETSQWGEGGVNQLWQDIHERLQTGI